MAKDTIRKVEFIDRVVDNTYNVQVADNANYYADGILVHNCDDPINPKQAASTIERENANYFVTSTLSTRKVDKEITPLILIMQRLHEGDPTGEMLARSNIFAYRQRTMARFALHHSNHSTRMGS